MLYAQLLIHVLIFLNVVLVQSKSDCGQKGRQCKISDKSICYDDLDDPYLYFATKTGYHQNRNKDDKEIKHKGCEARLFWILSRHGTRNPGTEDMEELKAKLPILREATIKNHKEGRGNLCEDDLENLEDWTFRANVSEDKYLVKEGYSELKDIGKRYQERFPTLLTRPFVNDSYIFQYTDSERTEASAKSFAQGMFGKNDANVWFRKPAKPDLLLRFYKYCNRWKKEVDDNPLSIIEKTLFESTEEFTSMVKSVSNRMGFIETLNLTQIDMLYDMCSFDKAWRPKKLSPWCAVFSEEDLKIMEYREDLEYFYEDGYGFDVNYKQSCPVVKDVYQRFRNVIEEAPDNQKGVFYFTHSGTILKVLARFGLFEDDVVLKHSNRLSPEVVNRQWKTSLIDSFASNLALVLFRCQDNYRVAAYVQERPVQLPGCSDMMCHFSEFSAKYGPIAANCDFDGICKV